MKQFALRETLLDFLKIAKPLFIKVPIVKIRLFFHYSLKLSTKKMEQNFLSLVPST